MGLMNITANGLPNTNFINIPIMRFVMVLLPIVFLAGTAGCQPANKHKITHMNDTVKHAHYNRNDSSRLTLDENEWKKLLSPEVYEISRLKGTERPFTGKYYQHKEAGTYYCAACGNPLFSSDGKFESSCGWPSFFEPISKGSIIYTPDYSHGMQRTEVMCGRCKGHLGHVFEDGPPPTGLRYCINSVILDFEMAKAAAEKYPSEGSGH
jgi:peptide-methionine (R)-S-oxide reductase